MAEMIIELFRGAQPIGGLCYRSLGLNVMTLHRSYGKGSGRMRVASIVPGSEETTLPSASCTSITIVP